MIYSLSRIAVVLLALGVASTAYSAGEYSESHRQVAAELLTLTNARENGMVGATAMADAIIQSNPMLGPYRDVLLEWSEMVLSWENMEPKFVQLYVEAYTQKELEGLVKFYGTPLGQKTLEVTPKRRNVLQTLELQSDFSPREARRRCDEMLDKVGLGPRIHHYPNDLSGGQKQRVAIARALVHRPKLVLADEPTAALDAKTGREIIELFQRLAREQGTAVLVVTHNMRLLDAADEIVRMDDGRLGTAVTEQISLAFPTLSESQLIEVAAHARQRTYRPGETIIRQGDEANEFFILLEGEAGVLCEVPGVGSDHLFRFNRRGDYFGEIGLLQDHGRRMATVVAGGLTDTQVLVIERAAFVAMIDESRLTRAVIRDEMLERLERLASVRGSVV